MLFFAFDNMTARIFFEVLSACHSLNKFIIGIISIAVLLRSSVSTLSFRAMKRILNEGKYNPHIDQSQCNYAQIWTIFYKNQIDFTRLSIIEKLSDIRYIEAHAAVAVVLIYLHKAPIRLLADVFYQHFF